MPSVPGYRLHTSSAGAMGSIPVLGTKEGKLVTVDIIWKIYKIELKFRYVVSFKWSFFIIILAWDLDTFIICNLFWSKIHIQMMLKHLLKTNKSVWWQSSGADK